MRGVEGAVRLTLIADGLRENNRQLLGADAGHNKRLDVDVCEQANVLYRDV